MSKVADGLSADRSAVLAICAGLGAADWTAPSGCPGWSVQDVVAHLGALYWLVVDPSRLPDVTGLPTERAQDVHVEARRAMSAAEVADDYAQVSAKAIEVLATFDGQDAEIPLGDLGSYPMRLLPAAYSFDHYTHIRADLFAPRGPLAGPPPAADELRLAPVLDWIAAALPQQSAGPLAALDGAIEFTVEGPAARTITAGSGPVRARISAPAPLFVRAITQRATWQEPGIAAAGDPAALDIAGQLRVF